MPAALVARPPTRVKSYFGTAAAQCAPRNATAGGASNRRVTTDRYAPSPSGTAARPRSSNGSGSAATRHCRHEKDTARTGTICRSRSCKMMSFSDCHSRAHTPDRHTGLAQDPARSGTCPSASRPGRFHQPQRGRGRAIHVTPRKIVADLRAGPHSVEGPVEDWAEADTADRTSHSDAAAAMTAACAHRHGPPCPAPVAPLLSLR